MKHLALLTIISVFSFSVLAQEKGLDKTKREKLDALKIAHITETLQLTPEEAQGFWPIYNELEGEMRAIRKKRRKNRIDTKQNHDTMSDNELRAAIDAELGFEQEEIDLKKKYNEKLFAVLPVKKVALLHEAHAGFKRKLLKSARERKH